MQDMPSSMSIDPIVRIEKLEEEFDVEIAKELAQAFLDDTGDALEKIDAAFASQDQEGVRSVAHLLKGCSRVIQAWKCEQVSARLENCARDGDWTGASANAAELKQAYSDTQAFLRQYLG
jgi:HPt (histidine-containing phosphotransfer) domain-containing protein